MVGAPIMWTQCGDSVLCYIDHNVVFSLGCGQTYNQQLQKSKQIDDDLYGHTARAIQCDAHWPMEHIHGFMWSH